MPTQRIALRIFLASPSDLTEEREIVSEVVNTVNGVWRKKSSLQFELLRWENDTFPAFRSDPQIVVTEQIGDDYDVFIGILWSRFGTQTPRAESGTAEEFQRAYERHIAGEDVVVSMYFQDAALAPSKIDPSQLQKIKEFQDEVEKKGGLYHTFVTTTDFREKIHFQLSSILLDFAQRQGAEIRPAAAPIDNSSLADDYEETLGLLDHLEMATDHMQRMNESNIKIADSIELCNVKITSITKEIQEAIQTNNLPVIIKSVNKASESFDELTKDMRRYKDDMKNDFTRSVEHFQEALNLSSNFNPMALHEKNKLVRDLNILQNGLTNASEAIFDYAGVIENLPPGNAKLNRARRRLLNCLDEMLTDFMMMRGMWDEVVVATGRLPTNTKR